MCGGRADYTDTRHQLEEQAQSGYFVRAIDSKHKLDYTVCCCLRPHREDHVLFESGREQDSGRTQARVELFEVSVEGARDRCFGAGYSDNLLQKSDILAMADGLNQLAAEGWSLTEIYKSPAMIGTYCCSAQHIDHYVAILYRSPESTARKINVLDVTCAVREHYKLGEGYRGNTDFVLDHCTVNTTKLEEAINDSYEQGRRLAAVISMDYRETEEIIDTTAVLERTFFLFFEELLDPALRKPHVAYAVTAKRLQLTDIPRNMSNQSIARAEQLRYDTDVLFRIWGKARDAGWSTATIFETGRCKPTVFKDSLMVFEAPVFGEQAVKAGGLLNAGNICSGLEAPAAQDIQNVKVERNTSMSPRSELHIASNVDISKHPQSAI